MWFLDFEMGFDQGFWVLGRLYTVGASFVALVLLRVNPDIFTVGYRVTTAKPEALYRAGYWPVRTKLAATWPWPSEVIAE